MEEEMWLARDKNNSLWLFVGRRPQKVETTWYNRTPYYVALDSHSFPEVKWSDDEPTKVKLEIVKQ